LAGLSRDTVPCIDKEDEGSVPDGWVVPVEPDHSGRQLSGPFKGMKKIRKNKP